MSSNLWLSIVSNNKDHEGIKIGCDSDDKSKSYLYYNKKSENGTVTKHKIKYNKNSIQKPIYKSELYNKIESYRWFLYKNIYLAENDTIKVAKEFFPESQVYSLNRGGIVDSTKLTESNVEDLELAWEELLNNLDSSEKENIENMVKTNEVYLLNNSKVSIDFLDTPNTCSLIDFDSEVYTNTLDIKKLINKKSIKNNTTLKVDLSIQYSKKLKNNEVVVYNFDISFSGIEVKEDKLAFKNFISEQNNIRIEYLNGIIQLFPLFGEDNNIVECIISNCLVTYGNNSK